MANNPRGFIESGGLHGPISPITRTRKVKAANALSIFPGDPVVLVSGNTVARIPAAATAASLPVLGVVRAILNSNGRPLTHNLPATGNYLPASTAGYVQVNEHPEQVYTVNTDATVVSTLIGQYVEVTAAAANSAAGISGISIEVATGTNTAANTVPFQVVGLSPNNLGGAAGTGQLADGFIPGEANQDVEVIIAQHTWRNTNKAR